MWKVQLFELNYDSLEEEAVLDVIRSRWITMGENTKRFEEDFKQFLDCQELPTAVTNCTAALHMALLAMDIGHGDEVIISGLTFIADANVVKMVGATPVLADVDSITNWNISARTIQQCITSRTKAVIAVHFAGVPCDMDEIQKLCREKDIALIEDVAHAPGAEYNGIKCGNFGDISCFSFFTNKNISVGEGGMVIAKNKELNEKIKFLRSHGMTSLTLDRHKGRAITYDVVQAGLNYRIDEMRAALGRVQLKKLLKANSQRQELHEYYGKLLKDLPVTIPFEIKINKTSAYHIYPILLSHTVKREDVINSLKENGIQTSIHYPSIKKFSAYSKILSKSKVPICDQISEQELTLPLYPTMTKENIEYVVEKLKQTIS